MILIINYISPYRRNKGVDNFDLSSATLAEVVNYPPGSEVVLPLVSYSAGNEGVPVAFEIMGFMKIQIMKPTEYHFEPRGIHFHSSVLPLLCVCH